MARIFWASRARKHRSANNAAPRPQASPTFSHLIPENERGTLPGKPSSPGKGGVPMGHFWESSLANETAVVHGNRPPESRNPQRFCLFPRGATFCSADANGMVNHTATKSFPPPETLVGCGLRRRCLEYFALLVYRFHPCQK